MGILIAITVILRSYNNQPQPNWNLGLNLNTMIAVLATLLRSSLVTIVEEVISQLKWSWQHRSRPASHLTHFDKASRGPLGALLVCFRIPALLDWRRFISQCNNSTVIACLVTVLSLAAGAFTQQAIETVPCRRPVPGANVSLPVATYARPFLNDSDFNWSSWELDVATKARIVASLGSLGATRPAFLQNCSTGNCTFEAVNGISHVTSGFCARCVETTDLFVKQTDVKYNMQFSEDGYNRSVRSLVRLYSSPPLVLANDGSHATNIGLAVNADVTGVMPSKDLPGSLPNNSVVAINVASITRAQCSPGFNCSGFWTSDRYDISDPYIGDVWAPFNVVSAHCGLYKCARHLKAEAENARFVETLIREQLYEDVSVPVGDGPNDLLISQQSTVFIPPCWQNGTRYDKQRHNLSVLTDSNFHIVQQPLCSYGVSPSFGYQVRDFLADLANGNCSAFMNRGHDNVNCQSGYGFDNDFCRSGRSTNSHLCRIDYWWLQSLFNYGNATFQSITAVMENLALALTDSARAQSYPSVSYVPGTIWKTEVCTEFNWPWISFPAALTVLTVIALASVTSTKVSDKEKIPFWKSSILPLMYGRDAITGLSVMKDSLKEMEKNSDKDVIVLEKDGDRWRLRSVYKADKRNSGSVQNNSCC